jgi:hypothetical protein
MGYDMVEIKDSGNRTDLGTGAVKDVASGKGKPHLIPPRELALIINGKHNDKDVLDEFYLFKKTRNEEHLVNAICSFVKQNTNKTIAEFIKDDLAKHYEGSVIKDPKRHFEREIPLHCHINSALRNYLQIIDGVKANNNKPDENFASSFVYNVINIMWTIQNRKDLIDETSFELFAKDDKTKSFEKTSALEGKTEFFEKGKGRCDLIPSRELMLVMNCKHDDKNVMDEYALFRKTGNEGHLVNAICSFIKQKTGLSRAKFFYDELAMHYEMGVAGKYAPRNYEKGTPIDLHIDSALRHYMQFINGDKDEPHARAFVWNAMSVMWTKANRKDMVNEDLFEVFGD